MVNAHRVLRRHRASPTSREQMEKLTDEGVVFDANGKAIAELRCNDEFLRTALDDGDEQQAAT
jgi:hypothetical protein